MAAQHRQRPSTRLPDIRSAQFIASPSARLCCNAIAHAAIAGKIMQQTSQKHKNDDRQVKQQEGITRSRGDIKIALPDSSDMKPSSSRMSSHAKQHSRAQATRAAQFLPSVMIVSNSSEQELAEAEASCTACHMRERL